MYRRNQQGFTVVELLIVVIVIGALVSIAIPNYSGIIDRAEKVACKANMRSLELARTYRYINAGDYGASISDLETVFSEIGFIGDSSREDLRCPSGGEYVFETGANTIRCSIVTHNN